MIPEPSLPQDVLDCEFIERRRELLGSLELTELNVSTKASEKEVYETLYDVNVSTIDLTNVPIRTRVFTGLLVFDEASRSWQFRGVWTKSIDVSQVQQGAAFSFASVPSKASEKSQLQLQQYVAGNNDNKRRKPLHSNFPTVLSLSLEGTFEDLPGEVGIDSGKFYSTLVPSVFASPPSIAAVPVVSDFSSTLDLVVEFSTDGSGVLNGKGTCFLGSGTFLGSAMKLSRSCFKVSGQIEFAESKTVLRSPTENSVFLSTPNEEVETEDLTSPVSWTDGDHGQVPVFPTAVSWRSARRNSCRKRKHSIRCSNAAGRTDPSLAYLLDTPVSSSKMMRREELSSMQGRCPNGKRFTCGNLATGVSAPIIKRWEYLGNQRIRLHWEMQVLQPGQLVHLEVQVRSGSIVAGSGKLSKTVQLCCQNRNGTGKEQLLGYALSFKGGMQVCFPLLTMKPSQHDTYLRATQYKEALWHSAKLFTCVLDGFDVGKYHVEVRARLARPSDFDASVCDKQSCEPSQSDMEVEQHHISVTIDTSPSPPTGVTALLCKSKMVNVKDASAEAVYEPFVTLSWSIPSNGNKRPRNKCCSSSSRSRSLRYGKAQSVEVITEAFNARTGAWQEFGECQSVEMQDNFTTGNCTIVALPENRAPEATRQGLGLATPSEVTSVFSKFRLKVRSVNNFGKSVFACSPELDALKFSTKQQRSEPMDADEDSQGMNIDFDDCEEAQCVICSEAITFEQDYESISRSIAGVTKPELTCTRRKRSARMNCSHDGEVFCGLLHVEKKLNLLPVVPSCCSHMFHLKCILKWSVKSRERLETEFDEPFAKAKCPLCVKEFKYVIRQTLDPEKQNEREVICAMKTMLKDERMTRPLPFDEFRCFMVKSMSSCDPSRYSYIPPGLLITQDAFRNMHQNSSSSLTSFGSYVSSPRDGSEYGSVV